MSTVMDYKNQDVIPQSSCGGLPYQREALDTERSERIKAVAKNKGLSISHVLKLNKDFAIKEIEGGSIENGKFTPADLIVGIAKNCSMRECSESLALNPFYLR